ncbi:M48 family metallopeptidase [Thalassolituus oleivorans]|uniref:Heat shock protein HtpX n=1 Tax=Thalassolituus oleivorans MIL-1 TaxID=1298593 RepID=M5DYU1_9GAMM|nr:M48 family metallopeptidase [Thalassolituus oleivorans]CCU70699.1 Heat shock protein HtpX [Thalassolituus oleivorans MIL-1]
MNFFEHQDQARRRTGLLSLLFFLAVAIIVVLLNIVFIVALAWSSHKPITLELVQAQPEIWLLGTAGALLVIFAGSGYKWLELRKGGRQVADMLGGRKIQSNTQDSDEQQLLNVVAEMAIASSMPIPDVYVLDDDSINAFAAGHQPSDAIIGVTRGCMEKLSREQLQGVIAHEFSHILNGDMRLNMQLMALLFGILFIGLVGRLLMHSSSRSRNSKNNAGPMIGLGLMVIGYSGVFFGSIIRAAVSRQREFLADASAVQFTRNPDGISGALKVIGYGAGSDVHNPASEEMGHLFFGQAFTSRLNIFATHPPLNERINRLDPSWNGQYLKPRVTSAPREIPSRKSTLDSATSAIISGLAGATSGGHADTKNQRIEPENNTTAVLSERQRALLNLQAAAIEPDSARILIFSLLIASPNKLIAREQQDLVRKQHGQQSFTTLLQFYPAAQTLLPGQRLPLVEKSLTALREMSPQQYENFHTTLVKLAKADGEIDLFEWCLYRLILQYLGAHFNTVHPAKPRYSQADAVASEIATVISYVACAGQEHPEDIDKAYAAGIAAGGFSAVKRDIAHTTSGSLNPLNRALAKLTQAYPHIKGRIIKALMATITSDRHITEDERDMVKTIATILESPIPKELIE